MTQKAIDVLHRALELSLEERAELASTLIDSLDTTIDDDTEATWQREIARRIEELQGGKAKTVPWAAVRDKARAILDGKTRS